MAVVMAVYGHSHFKRRFLSVIQAYIFVKRWLCSKNIAVNDDS
jgi:hypothetical protein